MRQIPNRALSPRRMVTYWTLVLIAIAGMAFLAGTACSDPPSPDRQRKTVPSADPEPQAQASPKPSLPVPVPLADSINFFSLDLYRDLAAQPGNLVLSPASVYLGLAQLMAGARGQTEKELRDALYVRQPNESFHAGFGRLLDHLIHRNAGDSDNPRGVFYKLKWASRFWVNEKFAINPDFAAFLQANYQATAGVFNSPAVANEINEWVASRTENEIQNIIQAGQLNSSDPLVLVNAIFFEGQWLTPFPAEGTKPSPFHLSTGNSVPVSMMNLITVCTTGRGPGFSYITLPYKGDGISMVFLLPDNIDGLASLEESFDWKTLGDVLRNSVYMEVEISLPKVDFENRFVLTPVLGKRFPSAFGAGANFSGIDPTNNIYLRLVIHAAKVKVDEEGTKAAAATVYQMATKGFESCPPRPKMKFIADHPYLFLIHDPATGLVLFIGRVTDPR